MGSPSRSSSTGGATSSRGTNGGIAGAVKEVSDHAVAIARLEIELAKLELGRKLGRVGLGAGLVVGAAIFALFALGFGFAAVAAAIALVLPTWAALLIVFGGLVLVAGVLGLVAVSSFKQGTPPVPEQAITEAKVTKEALRQESG